MASKLKKTVFGLLSFLMILIIAVVLTVLFWLGPTVKMVAQHIGSKALGTPLTINELKINPRDGTFHMTGFAIANQTEFGRNNAVSLDGMDISIDMLSLFSPTILVHRVEINRPYFVYEQSTVSDNVTEFIKNINTYLGPRDDEPEEPETEQDKDGANPKIVLVENLEVSDVQFHLANTDDPSLDIEAGIEQLSASMTNGTITLSNLYVSNPARLQSPDLFTLDGITIQLDTKSIYTESPSILDIQVTRPYAYLDKTPTTDTVAEFMRLAQRFADKPASTTVAPEKSSPQADTEKQTESGAPPIQLHNLTIDDIQLKLVDCATTNAPMEPTLLAGIGSVSVKLVDGNIQVREIRLPNPAGFATTNLFHLANIDVTIDRASVFSDHVQIENVLIDSPEINLEQTESTGNIAELQTLLMGFVPPGETEEGAPTPETDPTTGERPEPIPLDQQPVVLHELIVTNFAVNLTLPASTNEPSAWALDVKQLSTLNPMDKLSLGKLNPLALMAGNTTNSAETAESPEEGGPMKIVYFKRLTLQPLNGLFQIDDLGVANPQGFASRNLVKLDHFKLELDPDTLSSKVLLIRDILIDKPHIAYERRITTDNIKSLQTEIDKAVTRRNDAMTSAPKKEETEKTDDGQKVVIEHLLVKDGMVKAKLSVAPSIPIPLPDIDMSDIGKDSGGTTVLGAVTEIGTTIYDSIIGSVASTTGFAGDTLKGVGALTFGSLLNMGDGDEVVQPKEPETQDAVEVIVEPDKKKRDRRNYRLPGRLF